VLFDLALLWQPASGSREGLPLQDRVAQAEKSGFETAELPTWSWVRWSGGFDFSMWTAATDCLPLSKYDQYICEITPIVQWYKVCATSGDKRLIRNDYARFRGKELCPEAVACGFRLDSRSLGDADYQSFRYPIPIIPHQDLLSASTLPPPAHSTQCNASLWRPLVFGRVSRAFVTLEREDGDCTSSQWVTLLTAGVIVGVMRLQRPVPPQTKVEIIRLSEGCCPPRPTCKAQNAVGFSHTALSRWESQKKKYSFYNVMWISWAEGIAYRRAVGRIEKVVLGQAKCRRNRRVFGLIVHEAGRVKPSAEPSLTFSQALILGCTIDRSGLSKTGPWKTFKKPNQYSVLRLKAKLVAIKEDLLNEDDEDLASLTQTITTQDPFPYTYNGCKMAGGGSVPSPGYNVSSFPNQAPIAAVVFILGYQMEGRDHNYSFSMHSIA
jgi:hypothetical protein